MELNLVGSDKLPKGWVKLCLKDVRRKHSTTFNPARDPNATLELYSVPSHEIGKPEIVRSSEIGSSKQYVGTGDVLLSKINPRLNRSWVVGNHSSYPKIASTEWIVFEQNETVLSSFLQYILTDCRIRDYLSHNASGVGGSLTRVKPSLMDTIFIGLPPSDEQHRVVAKIEALFSELDKGVESLKTAREQLKIYRQAVLKHAFEGKLTARWREENADKLKSPEQLLARIQQEPVHMGDSDLSTTVWPCCRVRELLLEGPSNGRSVKDQTNGFPVLRLTALKGGKIDLSENKQGAWDREAAKPFIVKAGDFLLSRGNGSKHLVGRGGIVADHKEEVAFPDTMVRLRVNPDLMLVEFFSLLWESRIIREHIEKAARTTAGIYKINQRHIEGFMVPVPGIPEQKVIVAQLEEKLSIIDQQASEVELALSTTEILRQSILKKVFSGQLTPNEDHATECIRAKKCHSRKTR